MTGKLADVHSFKRPKPTIRSGPDQRHPKHAREGLGEEGQGRRGPGDLGCGLGHGAGFSRDGGLWGGVVSVTGED